MSHNVLGLNRLKKKENINYSIFNCYIDIMKSELKELSWDEAIKLGSPYNYVLAVTINNKGKPNIIGLGW